MIELGIVDPEIAAAIEDEFLQQSMTIELNAATNFPSPMFTDNRRKKLQEVI